MRDIWYLNRKYLIILKDNKLFENCFLCLNKNSKKFKSNKNCENSFTKLFSIILLVKYKTYLAKYFDLYNSSPIIFFKIIFANIFSFSDIFSYTFIYKNSLFVKLFFDFLLILSHF